MAIANMKPMMEDKAYMVREKESYKIPEAVWRKHLEQEGDQEIEYEVEAGGIVKRKMLSIYVDPEDGTLSGEVVYYLDVDSVDNVEVKGLVCMRKSGESRGLLNNGHVELTESGVLVQFGASLEDELYNQENFIKQNLEDGHLIYQIEIEICVKKEKFKVEKRKVNLMEDMKTIFDRETSQTDFTLVCEGQELPCHKALLKARSSVFKQGIEFNKAQGVPEASTKFEIKDSSPVAVGFMLDHIYGEYLISKVDNMYIDRRMLEGIPDPEDLLQLANYFNLSELVDICKEGLIWRMTPGNAVETLVNIDKHVPGDKEVKDKAIAFIKKHANDVIKSEGWGNFDKNYGDLVTDIVRAMATSE